MRISDWSSDVCSSDLASIDGEIHAGDVRTFIGGEEGDGRRDFLWLASATHRDLRSELGGRLLGLLRRKARRCLQRSEEHTSELQSLMRISYAVFCLKTKTTLQQTTSKKVTAHDRTKTTT